MTSLDVVVYSHLDIILASDLLARELGKVVRQFENLVSFHKTMLDLLAPEDSS